MKDRTIAHLRDIVPLRPLTRSEALQIAERQALRFLKLHALNGPAVDHELIAGLPRIEVRRLKPWPSSGASQWISGRWVIVLNASQPWTRQRFSLAHEFKHILDHRFASLVYGRIHPAQRAAFVEQVCEYFAGCLLIPRPWLKRAWCNGVQDTRRLAQHFDVSEAAIATRLTQVGLLSPVPRCDSRDLSAVFESLRNGGRSDAAGRPPTIYFRRSTAPAV